ncbi:hypothetical protein K933_02231 [Candidatus Halobonum tyrrellensis G22]|uniref:DUF7847 domain-containing protein n=1 Tax=Candidatus Halobonum tyrrellensis G22 TaxID=1324957 RepID=V4HJ00_9EURY|nr:hypothetical protein K933_02231 [Candidatus Halobonum tyrrellensis G22]
MLMGVFLLVTVFQAGLVYAVTTTVVPLGPVATPGAPAATGPSPGSQLPALVSLQAAFLASVAGGVLTVPVRVIVQRVLVSDRTERIPDEFVFHRLGWASLNSFVGSWVLSLSFLLVSLLFVGAGFWGLFRVIDSETSAFLASSQIGWVLLGVLGLVLFLPSVFLGINLLFAGQEIAVQDKSFLGAFAESWRLVRGNRLPLLLLVLIPMVPQAIVSYGMFALLPPLAAQVVSLLETTVVTVVVIGIMARAYVQLKGRENVRI